MTPDKFRRLLRVSILEIILLLLCVILHFTADGFSTFGNILNILRSVSMQGVIALGMTMVIIAGEIDLSVGSTVAFSGCLTAWVTGALGAPPELAIGLGMLAALLVSGAVGCCTGLLRATFRVPTFITTLAWMTILRGAAELITNGFPLTPFPAWYNYFGGGYLAGIPFPTIIFAGVFLIIFFVMHYTTFGRAVYAVGGNAEAARLSGINVRTVKIGVMATVAMTAALAGIMQSSQIMSGRATAAMGWELDVISAVIIGGTSLMGGSGSVWGTMVGVVFLGVLVNGMTLLNINEYWQHVVRGGLILLAVLVNMAPGERKK